MCKTDALLRPRAAAYGPHSTTATQHHAPGLRAECMPSTRFLLPCSVAMHNVGGKRNGQEGVWKTAARELEEETHGVLPAKKTIQKLKDLQGVRLHWWPGGKYAL